MSILSVVFGRQRARYQEAAGLPALVALLFIGHAVEDAGVLGALPYAIIILFSVWYIVKPNWFAWSILFALFVSYSCAVALLPYSATGGERLFFFTLGCVPALLLFVARPRGTAVTAHPRETTSLPDA